MGLNWAGSQATMSLKDALNMSALLQLECILIGGSVPVCDIIKPQMCLCHAACAVRQRLCVCVFGISVCAGVSICLEMHMCAWVCVEMRMLACMRFGCVDACVRARACVFGMRVRLC